MFEFHFGQTRIPGRLENERGQRNDFWDIGSLNRTASTKQRRILTEFFGCKVSEQAVIPAHITATDDNVTVGTGNVLLD